MKSLKENIELKLTLHYNSSLPVNIYNHKICQHFQPSTLYLDNPTHSEKVTFKASLINPIIIANFFILMPLESAIEPLRTSSRDRSRRHVVFEFEKLRFLTFDIKTIIRSKKKGAIYTDRAMEQERKLSTLRASAAAAARAQSSDR